MSRYFNTSDIPNADVNGDAAAELCVFLDNIRYHWSNWCIKKKIWFTHLTILPPMTNKNYNGYRIDFVPENKQNKKFQRWLEHWLSNETKYHLPFNKIYFCNPKQGVATFFQIELKGENNEQLKQILPYNEIEITQNI